MKPHSFQKLDLDNMTEEQRIHAQGWVARHGVVPGQGIPKGTVLPETTVSFCPRVKVADFPPRILPRKWIEGLEQNQKIASCCRHPENHEIEAFKSHPAEILPDIYIFYCTCGRKHRRVMLGVQDENRPVWKAS